MKQRNQFSRLIALAVILLVVGVLQAQPVPPQPPPSGPQAREQLEALRVWRLTQELNLTEDQSTQFFPRLKKLRQLRDDYRAAKSQILEELGAELHKDAPDAGQLKQMLDSVQSAEDSFRSAERRVRQEISQILSVEQQARMYVFQATFERQTRHMINQIEKGSKPVPRDKK
jgi:Spy/CpxP family protein refolding chaperone